MPGETTKGCWDSGFALGFEATLWTRVDKLRGNGSMSSNQFSEEET